MSNLFLRANPTTLFARSLHLHGVCSTCHDISQAVGGTLAQTFAPISFRPLLASHIALRFCALFSARLLVLQHANGWSTLDAFSQQWYGCALCPATSIELRWALSPSIPNRALCDADDRPCGHLFLYLRCWPC